MGGGGRVSAQGRDSRSYLRSALEEHGADEEKGKGILGRIAQHDNTCKVRHSTIGIC